MLELLPSFISGICAASAGVCGKYAFAPYEVLEWSELFKRGAGVASMLTLNAMMLQYFVKSISLLGSSRATLANFTCNYIISVKYT